METLPLDKNAVLVAGGGLAGLVAALLVAERGRPAPIFVIERAAEFGGLLRSIDKGVYGRFDHGMHTFTSSGIPELDDWIAALLPRQEWIVMEGMKRDLSGVFFEGKLQQKCHYPDLRALPQEQQEACAAQFFLNLGTTAANGAPAHLWRYAVERFGEPIAQTVFGPIVHKIYGLPMNEMDPIVAKVFPLDRVALYEEAIFQDLMKSDTLRARLAYPEQRNLDLKYASSRYSLYPKTFGAHQLPDALVARLQAAGVRLLTGTEIRKLTLADGRVKSVTLARGGQESTLEQPHQLIWTAGLPSLARLLELPSGNEKLESLRQPAVMSLLLDKPLEVGDLYYFWCWDPRFQAYRVTIYHNYCPAAPRAGGYPVGLEFALLPEQSADPAALAELAVEELQGMGLFPEGAAVLCTAGERLPVGFPTFSLRNRRLLENWYSELAEKRVENLAVTGIQAEWGIIYQPEVLTHVYNTVNRYLERNSSAHVCEEH